MSKHTPRRFEPDGLRLFFQKWFRRGPLRAGHGIPSSTGGISDQRSGEGVVRRNGCPKAVFLENPVLLCPLKAFRRFKGKSSGGREETDSPKTPF